MIVECLLGFRCVRLLRLVIWRVVPVQLVAAFECRSFKELCLSHAICAHAGLTPVPAGCYVMLKLGSCTCSQVTESSGKFGCEVFLNPLCVMCRSTSAGKGLKTMALNSQLAMMSKWCQSEACTLAARTQLYSHELFDSPGIDDTCSNHCRI